MGVLDAVGELGHLVVDLTSFGHEVADFIDRVDDCCVVSAAELTSDGRVRQVGGLSKHIHGDLAGGDQRATPARPDDLLDGKAEHVRGFVEDHRGSDLPWLLRAQEITKDALTQIDGQRLAGEVRERGDSDERTFEFTDVVRDAFGDEHQHVVWNVTLGDLGLLLKDGETCFDVGRLNVGDQAHLESTSQPIFERRDAVRRPIRGENDLTVRLMQGVEGVEELLLESFLAFDELNVIDEEHVDLSVSALELDGGVLANRIDELVQEGLGRDISNGEVWVVRVHVACDGAEKVCLAEPSVSVDEEWVVRLCRGFGHRQCSGMSEPVARSGHEVVERVPVCSIVLTSHGIVVLKLLGGREIRQVHVDSRRLGREVEHGRVDAEEGLFIDPDLQLHFERAVVRFGDRISDDAEISRLDAVLDYSRWNGNPDLAARQVDGFELAKGGVPHDVGDLCPNEVGTGFPQLICIRHVVYSTCFHRSFHRCGQPRTTHPRASLNRAPTGVDNSEKRWNCARLEECGRDPRASWRAGRIARHGWNVLPRGRSIGWFSFSDGRACVPSRQPWCVAPSVCIGPRPDDSEKR